MLSAHPLPRGGAQPSSRRGEGHKELSPCPGRRWHSGRKPWWAAWGGPSALQPAFSSVSSPNLLLQPQVTGHRVGRSPWWGPGLVPPLWGSLGILLLPHGIPAAATPPRAPRGGFRPQLSDGFVSAAAKAGSDPVPPARPASLIPCEWLLEPPEAPHARCRGARGAARRTAPQFPPLHMGSGQCWGCQGPG